MDRKLGRKPVTFDLPELKPILEETYGLVIYQEQVMQVAQKIAGYSLGEADLLRRAMGKKNKEEMDKQRERFQSGAKQNGYPPKKGGGVVRPAGEVRRVRLQQIALSGVRVSGVPDGVFEGALRGGVHGGAADIGNGQHG